MGKLKKKIRSMIFIGRFGILENLEHESFELFETDFPFIPHEDSNSFKPAHKRT